MHMRERDRRRERKKEGREEWERERGKEVGREREERSTYVAHCTFDALTSPILRLSSLLPPRLLLTLPQHPAHMPHHHHCTQITLPTIITSTDKYFSTLSIHTITMSTIYNITTSITHIITTFTTHIIPISTTHTITISRQLFCVKLKTQPNSICHLLPCRLLANE